MASDRNVSEKPWVCPEHPDAQVRHEWDRTRTDVRLTGASWESDTNHRYLCAVCSRELAAPPKGGTP